MKNRQSGFTLIELVIAVAIIGILAAIAVPQYGSYLTSSRRSDAQIALRTAAQEMERCRTQNNFTFVGCSPKNTVSESGHYDITAPSTSISASAYVITATAKTDSSQANDTGCTSMTINEKGITGPVPSATVPDCW